jgi:hypothetical protein
MRSSASQLLARTFASAIVGLIALTVGSQRTVQAGCLTSHKQSHASSDRFSTFFLLLDVAGALATNQADTPTRSAPCSGPACSQGSPEPFPESPSIIRIELGHWAILVPTWGPESPDPSGPPPMTASLGGVDALGSIFHPPRAALVVA